MRRLDICRFLPESADDQNPFVLILQARTSEALSSLVVAPLERARRKRLPELEIPVIVDGTPFIVLIHELSAEPKSEIGEVMMHADHLEWDVGKALDRLLFGV